ncbi:MAG: FAD-binding oxidoreductase [Apilactobacillus sp.]|uniref:NAD(P)/FAD-dependent oxidoreductase n=1 Tax=Apilactobacillus TaxID=2767877 RepID=UPI0025E478EE|nr:FAD-dependent oxidoreductase [Apilactobacillus sp.]MCT6822314.1 FAD-binding oxidoreductase [Apilactobacillus sp.]MCT6857656.1 FAD-binding oxidoreductase [Apilactobacillus sp.]
MTQSIAIIGGGIVGSTAAYYLSEFNKNNDLDITVFDHGCGQATKAAAGIISPWLSKRRNKSWYELAKDGATLLNSIADKTNMPEDIYNQCGTIITRNNLEDITELYDLAIERSKDTETIGEIYKLTPDEIKRHIPIINSNLPGLLVTGGARIKGDKYTDHLLKIAKSNGVSVINKEISINENVNVVCDRKEMQFDKIILATGAWTKNVLSNLPLDVDIRPQKGQLIELSINDINLSHEDMPVLMPEGESDFIPLGNGRLIVGASHENDKDFDLNPDADVIDELLNSATSLLPSLSAENLIRVKIGTRAYTSDFSPFFGKIPGYEKILVGSGLGSSGLTTGPLVGKILAEMAIDNLSMDIEKYRKPIENYIKLVK